MLSIATSLFPFLSPRRLTPFVLNLATVSAALKHRPPPQMTSILAEYAKSKRAKCKTCSETIDAKTLRLGVVTRDKRFGHDVTRWHHFSCFSFDSVPIDSAESISGLDNLQSDDREAVKKLFDERVEVKDTDANIAAEDKPKSTKKMKVKDTDGDGTANDKVEDTDGNVASEDKLENTKKRKIALDMDSEEKEPKASILAEYAKSKRSKCKTCSETIDAKTLRLGVVTKDKRLNYDMTSWHHFSCFSFDSVLLDSPESISGFDNLQSDDQEAVKKLFDERVEVKNTDAEDKPKSTKKRKVKDTDGDGTTDDKVNITKKKKVEDTDGNVAAEDKLENTKKRKIEDRGLDMDSGEKEPKKLQLSVSDDAEIKVALSVSDIKDMYKDATLLAKWRAFHSIIFLEKDDGLQDSSKIAAFDFDGCLANTNVKISGENAWSLMFPCIPDKLQKLYNDGFKLVIFTNESNIDRWTKKRQKAVDSKVGRLNNFIKRVNVPIQVFIACGFDKKGKPDAYRKPQPGMWRVMEKHFNSDIPIDMEQSFYVGDAAGRPNDHSDADIKFAETIGLKFYLPEEFFDTKD